MQQQYNIVKDLLTPADHPTNVFTKTRVAFRGNMEEMCTYINKTTVLKSFLYSIIKSCFTVSSMLTFSLSYLHKKQLAFMSFARQLYVYDFLKRKSTILFKKKNDAAEYFKGSHIMSIHSAYQSTVSCGKSALQVPDTGCGCYMLVQRVS